MAGVSMPRLTKLGSVIFVGVLFPTDVVVTLETLLPLSFALDMLDMSTNLSCCCCCCCCWCEMSTPLATLVASLSILFAVALAAIKLLTDLVLLPPATAATLLLLLWLLLALMDTKPSVLRIKLLLLLPVVVVVGVALCVLMFICCSCCD